MDEYFEQHDCLHHPSFVQLTDTLVAATLNYYNTDFGTLLETEIAQNLSGTGGTSPSSSPTNMTGSVADNH